MVPGACLDLIGIFMYGWTAQYRLHWIAPDIDMAIFGSGIVSILKQCKRTSPRRVLITVHEPLRPRSFFSAHKLGYGWGNSILGLAFLVLAAPAQSVPWLYGARMRAIGKHK
ncbi:hypothetical protein LLEC1_03829 [Akanthomyces lecanii]|uniref:Uncharacterized protein n=1 Tax=Cordyceps confragosa TaxID=2714763 RepID=A0A179IDY4_CORDF|nr:hypothetical protein LLEC1_03829 [Akanthomyces lecanii]